jgi:hypothetical protein
MNLYILQLQYICCRIDAKHRRENRQNGNQESSQKDTREEGSKKGYKEKVAGLPNQKATL